MNSYRLRRGANYNLQLMWQRNGDQHTDCSLCSPPPRQSPGWLRKASQGCGEARCQRNTDKKKRTTVELLQQAPRVGSRG